MRYDEGIFVQDELLATLTYKTLIRQAVEEMFERLDGPWSKKYGTCTFN